MSENDNTKNSQPGSTMEARVAALEELVRGPAADINTRINRLEAGVARLQTTPGLAERLTALEDSTSPAAEGEWTRLSDRISQVGSDWRLAHGAVSQRVTTLENAPPPPALLDDNLADRLARLEKETNDAQERISRLSEKIPFDITWKDIQRVLEVVPLLETGFSKLQGDFDQVTHIAASAGLSPQQLNGIRSCVLNIANIYHRTGHHEVQVAMKELARGLCFVIGESHAMFFPPAPGTQPAPEPNAATVLPGAPGPGFPMAAQVNGMVAAVAAHAPATPAPGISVPGMAPSPFAIPSQNDPQGSAHPVMGSPQGPAHQGPNESRMEVVSDPNGQMGPNGGPPPGTPGVPGSVPSAPLPPQPGAPFPPHMPVQAPPPQPPQAPAAAEQPAVTLDQLAAQFSPMNEGS